MRALLSVVSTFNVLASAWLFTMFLVLRHPGFEARAALSALFVALGVATLVAVNLERAAPVLRAGVALGNAALAALGAWVIAQNNAAPHFEGYLLLIGASFVVQGVLTVGWRLSTLRRAS